MTEKDIIREVMKEREISQARLADKIEGWSQSNITGLLNNNKSGIKIDNLYKLFNALSCDIVVRDRLDHDKEWIIDFSNVEEPKKKRKRSVDLDGLLKD